MNTKYIRLATLALAGMIFEYTFALSMSEVTSEKFPDADSVVLDMFDYIEYNPDGTYVSESSQTTKILTEKGRREETEIEVNYNARYTRAFITSLSITSEDGTRREIDLAPILTETTDNSSASENIYDPMAKKLFCPIPNVKIGDVITYTTRRETFASRIKDQWADVKILEWSCPILKATVMVKSPAGRPLKKYAIRRPLGNVTYSEKTLEDGSILRTWIAENSPQMFPEPDMPAQYTQVQSLRTSTADDWRDISRWYWEVSLPHLEKTNTAITNKVEEIVAKAKADNIDVMSAIYKWVSQEIRYMGLTMEDTSPGYAPHDVDITFGNKYGVCRDKAALLVAMLRIAGYEAYPVLIHAGAKMDEEVAMPYFNHAIASVAKGDGSYILMDPTDESSRDLMPAYLSDRSFLVATPEGERLLTSPVPSADENAVKISSLASLNPDGSMIFTSHVIMTGINDNIYRSALLRRKDTERRKLFERNLMAISPGAELLNIEILPKDLQDTTKPIEINLSARLPETLIYGETGVELLHPMLSRTLGAANWLLGGKTSLEKRNYPLCVDSTARVDEELEIYLNGAVGEVIYLPPDLEITGDYEWERTMKAENSKLIVRRSNAINAVEFSPEAYQKIREEMKKSEAAERQRPIFARTSLKNANARIIQSRKDIWLSSARDWVVTNSVVQQVLTYDGKKKLSELKFEYNPQWEKIEIVSAAVSNSNGRVFTATEREINTFDCDWVASAPRYPASRKIIVNLPGVEVGSFINYTIVREIKDAPLEFYGRWFLDSTEPTDEITINLNGETITEKNVKTVTAETMDAHSILWRNSFTVSSNDFAVVSARLREATDVKPLKLDARGEKPWGESIQSIRDWMSKNIRIAGPSLWETRIESQTTAPEKIIEERYASRLDYIRTMTALMKGAGFDADIVFSSLDSGEAMEIRLYDITAKPHISKFCYPLCRVKEKSGAFLWFGGEEKTYFIGTESEYTPLGSTPYEGSTYIAPQDISEEIKAVTPTEENLSSFKRETMICYVRKDGAVDFEIENTTFGPSVGAFRKQYAEILPEDRARHYQELLGEIAQGASATGELETDYTGYPARLAYKAYVPDYAVIEDDRLTIALPAFYEQLFPIGGARRENPIGISGCYPEETSVKIVFPEGYTQIEHLPDNFTFLNPKNGKVWYTNTVTSSIEEVEGLSGKRLVVRIERYVNERDYEWLGKEYAGMLRDWSRIGSSRANRTISVRAKAQ